MNRLLGRRVLALAFRVQSLGFQSQGFCKGWDFGTRGSCGFARAPEGFYEGLGLVCRSLAGFGGFGCGSTLFLCQSLKQS